MYLILLVYFVAGLSGITSVSSIFFNKQFLTLNASELVALGTIATLPWSAKILLGLLVDKTRFSYRSWVVVGSILSLITASLFQYLSNTPASLTFSVLALISFFSATGAALSDLSVDALAVSIPKTPEEITKVQLYSRIAQVTGGLLGAAATGWLASQYSPQLVFLVPVGLYSLQLLLTASLPIARTEKQGTDLQVTPGLLAAVSVYLISIFVFADNPVYLFLASASTIGVLAWRIIKPSKELAYSLIGLFLLRAIPGAGPGLNWYYLEHLKFDAIFLGQLSFLSSVAGLLGTIVLSYYLLKANVFRTSLWLTVALTILSLPDILIYYGYHDTLGISAKSLVLIDAELVAPLANFFFIIGSVIIAKQAPERGKALYMSLTASLLNISLIAGDALTFILTQIYQVTRTDFSQLGMLLTVGLIVSTILNVIGLLMLRRSENGTR